MTVELIRYLKERFKEEKLFLFGISWGSVLALDAAVAAPNLIDGAVAAGQVLLPPLLSEEFFSAAEASSAPNKVKERLREIRIQTEKTNGDIALISKVARRYTDAYRGAKGGAKSPVKEIFASKDYRFCDALACFSNGYRKNASLMRELSKIDLREKFSRVEIPYTVYGGERDIVTPVKDVAELFAQLKKELPEAVFAANDLSAIGAVEALMDSKIRVPEQVSVAGCDDIEIARLVRPSITTVRTSFEKQGMLAVKYLMGMITGEKKGCIDVLQGKIIPRDSTCVRRKPMAGGNLSETVQE